MDDFNLSHEDGIGARAEWVDALLELSNLSRRRAEKIAGLELFRRGKGWSPEGLMMMFVPGVPSDKVYLSLHEQKEYTSHDRDDTDPPQSLFCTVDQSDGGPYNNNSSN